MNLRRIIFLRDILYLSLTCFGGPQAHLAHFHRVLVHKRRYLTDNELLELNALCQVLPGPTSTQTLSALGYRLGGPVLAYLTLLIWMAPSVCIMLLAGIFMGHYGEIQPARDFTRYIQPIAVALVAHGAYTISLKTVGTKTGLVIMVISAVITFFIHSPFVFPAVLLVAGSLTAINYKKHPHQKMQPVKKAWPNAALWLSVLVVAALAGSITKNIPELRPIRLFENFYRNGSLVFGGGQALVPMLYTEFVEYSRKQYLTSEEFLSGFAFSQALPGPVFSFSAYIGALSMREYGVGGEIFGGLMSAFGLFLPGVFLLFFLIRVWESLKTFRMFRASLEGVTAASAGFIATAAILLFQPLDANFINVAIIIVSFVLIVFAKIPSWAIIILGLLLGLTPI